MRGKSQHGNNEGGNPGAGQTVCRVPGCCTGKCSRENRGPGP